MAAPVSLKNVTKFRWISSILRRQIHSTSTLRNEAEVSDPAAAVDDEEHAEREAEIERNRDVCRLHERVEPLLKSRARLRKPVIAYDLNLRRMRQEYARLGAKSGLDPSICFPTPEEIRQKAAWEAEWEPSFEERIQVLREQKEVEEEYMTRRSAEVKKNLENMPKLLKAYHDKQKKKETLQEQQQQKRLRLLEEAREYFGYDIDPRDPKFQEMAAKKEEEAKLAIKKEKKAKRLAAKTASITS